LATAGVSCRLHLVLQSHRCTHRLGLQDFGSHGRKPPRYAIYFEIGSSNMFKLLDQTFWKFLSGFVLILIVSFSLLTILGVWREAKENYAAIFQGFQSRIDE